MLKTYEFRISLAAESHNILGRFNSIRLHSFRASYHLDSISKASEYLEMLKDVIITALYSCTNPLFQAHITLVNVTINRRTIQHVEIIQSYRRYREFWKSVSATTQKEFLLHL